MRQRLKKMARQRIAVMSNQELKDFLFPKNDDQSDKIENPGHLSHHKFFQVLHGSHNPTPNNHKPTKISNNHKAKHIQNNQKPEPLPNNQKPEPKPNNHQPEPISSSHKPEPKLMSKNEKPNLIPIHKKNKPNDKDKDKDKEKNKDKLDKIKVVFV